MRRIQIVIGVHDERRPVRRAIESVISDEFADAIVVAHGIDPGLLDVPLDNPRVTLLECRSGRGKPGVAYNYGVERSSAPFVGHLGSDDWYNPGALTAMLEAAYRHEADFVLAPLGKAKSERGLRPITLRSQNLSGERDRLFYRTAPLGIGRREVMNNPRYKMTESVTSGMDLQASVAMWTDGLRISYKSMDPAYVVGSDAAERVSSRRRSLEEITEAPRLLLEQRWVWELPKQQRYGLAVKLLRSNMIDYAAMYSAHQAWRHGDEVLLRCLVDDIMQLSGVAIRALSANESRIIDEIRSGNPESIQRALARRRSSPLRERALPRNPLDALRHDSLLRRGLVTQAWRFAVRRGGGLD